MKFALGRTWQRELNHLHCLEHRRSLYQRPSQPSSDSFWKKNHFCQDEEEYQLLPQANAAYSIWKINGMQWLFSPFSCTFLFEWAADAALFQKASSKFVSRQAPSEVRIMHVEFMYIYIDTYVDKINTSWQLTLKAASQALMNSTSLAWKIAPFGWMLDTAFNKFNKQHLPDQSQDVIPLRWFLSQFHLIQRMLRKGTQRAQEHMYRARPSTASQGPVCLSSFMHPQHRKLQFDASL